MSYITQDQVLVKDKCRDILRNVKAEMLQQIEKKEHKSKNKKSKKHKDEKSKTKKKLHKNTKYNSNNYAESSFDVRNRKKVNKSEKNKTRTHSVSSKSSDEFEWVEKKKSLSLQRDSWMSEPPLIKTYCKERIIEEKVYKAYDPAASTRELNAYWKTTGTGLPTFQKPYVFKDDSEKIYPEKVYDSKISTGSWKKTNQNKDIQINSSINSVKTKQDRIYLNDHQLNELGAKIIKTEIMGNMQLAEELKQQLNEARQQRIVSKETKDNEDVLLIHTDGAGNNRPIPQLSRTKLQCASYAEHRYKKDQQKYVRTHNNDKRLHYFVDDDNCSLKEMFLKEKYISAVDVNREFLITACKQSRNVHDTDDIFTTNISKSKTNFIAKNEEMRKSIKNQQIMAKVLENCNKCLDSRKMLKEYVITLGQKVYVALAWRTVLLADHCIIAPIQHTICSTQLDEDAWQEVTFFRKILTRLFADQQKDVIFYEIANSLNKKTHMTIHCIPIDQSKSEMAPFYFKKAIEESEKEWSINKQLISLKGKSLLSCVPKGLPYFWVNFGMDTGFAHIIEDEDRFPLNFAEEIIGGMLHLEPNHWRKLHKQHYVISNIKTLKDLWKKYC